MHPLSSPDSACSAGHGGASCDPCEIGKYKTGAGSENCASCGTGKTTENTGATDITLCGRHFILNSSQLLQHFIVSISKLLILTTSNL